MSAFDILGIRWKIGKLSPVSYDSPHSLSMILLTLYFLWRSLDGATFPWWCLKAELLYVSICPVVRMRSDSIKWSSVNLLCMLQSVGWWGSKMKLDFSTAVTGKLHKFCWFLLGGAIYPAVCWSYTESGQWPWSNVFIPFFSLLQKTVQLEDQLQRCACS